MSDSGIVSSVAVSVEGLSKNFGDFKAVDNISFTVGKGEIFGFLGPNGAGKTTTIKILCGLIAPSQGRAQVAGFEVGRESQQIKENIGYMSQRFSLYPDLTVEENITFFSGIYALPAKEIPERTEWTLKMAGLTEKRTTLTRDLAGGWKQRLALGCALLHRPPIIFLDEPTSGVDPISRREFWDLIYSLAHEGVTVFVTTHYMDEAEYCHRLALMTQGRIIALDAPEALKEKHLAGRVWELDCDRPLEAIDLLQSHPLMAEIAVFGSVLHAIAGERREDLSEISGILRKAGITVSSLKPIPPSLEDVFVFLTKRDNHRQGSAS